MYLGVSRSRTVQEKPFETIVVAAAVLRRTNDVLIARN